MGMAQVSAVVAKEYLGDGIILGAKGIFILPDVHC